MRGGGGWKSSKKREQPLTYKRKTHHDIPSFPLPFTFLISMSAYFSDSSDLDSAVEMPLFTEAIDRALNSLTSAVGPPHIKVLAMWDKHYKQR